MKQTLKRNILFTLFCLLTVTMAAQDNRDLQMKKKIQQAAAAIQTMQCDFTQTKQLKMLNDQLVSKGKLYYQKSDKLRWEYVTPYAYTFILNGRQVLLKRSNRSDVMDVAQNKIFKEIAQIMMSSVTGTALTDEKRFKVSIQEEGTEYIATLWPQQKTLKQTFQKMVVHLSRQQGVVSSIILTEKNGDQTVINLKNIRLNETIGANMFMVR